MTVHVLAGAVAPSRSAEQRMAALAQANRIRVARAAAKRDMQAGRLGPVDVLLAVPWHMESMKVADFLLCVPKVGRVKARAVLQRCGVSPSRSLGGLTDRQRCELVVALRAGR